MMRIRTPSRLHFGPLAYGVGAARQFGGLGLMIDEPAIVVEASVSSEWTASGPLSERALRVAGRVNERLSESGNPSSPLALRIVEATAEHVGLGTGTQLSLAVARLVSAFAGREDLDAPRLAALTGRGLRSGVGLHGFDHGGLIVEGGHKLDGGVAPLLCRMEFPEEWSSLVVSPSSVLGRHGDDEVQAFSTLPPMPEDESNRLCRLVLLGILPAVAERDLPSFGEALTELQLRVGTWFAPAQGGIFASAELEAMVQWLRNRGLHGVGQSSWGPSLYGFTREGEAWRDDLLRQLRSEFGGGEIGLWTKAHNRGVEVTIL